MISVGDCHNTRESSDPKAKEPVSQKEEPPPAQEEEPFLLTVLPFAGLGLLLLIAVGWRVLPREENRKSRLETRSHPPCKSGRTAPYKEISVDSTRDFSLGPETAQITIVEYSDFECPYCRNASVDVKQVLVKYKGDVRVVFKNYPLDIKCNEKMSRPMHNHAVRGSRYGALCRQGRS